MSTYPYPVPEAVARVAMLTHPADLAEIIEAIALRVEQMHNGAEVARLASLTHGALQSLEDAAASLKVAADAMPDADFEKAVRVGEIRQAIFSAMRPVA